MNTHTPGPWTVDRPVRNYEYTITCDMPDGKLAIADIPDTGNATEANARLIAAAPELLAVLKDYADLMPTIVINPVSCPDLWDQCHKLYQNLLAAIAKAEGHD